MSGFVRPDPSTVTGPRLAKLARTFAALTALVENAASKSAGGVEIVLQPGPSAPTAASTKIPAA